MLLMMMYMQFVMANAVVVGFLSDVWSSDRLNIVPIAIISAPRIPHDE